MSEDQATELYRRFRPKNFKQVIGQPQAVKQLEGFLTNGGVPHSVLLTGPSGVGKTTLARILQKKLDCHVSCFREINCADSRGVDTVREIKAEMRHLPLIGKCKIYLLDEVHRTTGDAQSALLKILEDTPKHVHFMLATTDPQKLLNTIRTRCTEIKLQPVSEQQLKELLSSILAKENIKIDSAEVVERIAEVADGSPRKALVLLQQVSMLQGSQLEAVQKSDVRRVAFDIAKHLMWESKPNWPKLAEIIKGCEEEPESIRRLILSIATTEMLKANKNAGRAYNVILAFEGDFFTSGRAGLVRAAYEVLNK